MTIALAVLGASGKMGKRIIALASADPLFHIVETMKFCDVVIDFTAPEATLKHLASAVEAQKPLVIGTTGHTSEIHAAIKECSKKIPILYSPNFSFGITFCLEAAAKFARTLNCTIEISETHHIHKKDRPSGTALAFAHAMECGQENKITIRSIREGEVIGEHKILFNCGNESIELKHTVHSRDAFAHGALLAAKFLVNQPPGLYSLKNLFPH